MPVIYLRCLAFSVSLGCERWRTILKEKMLISRVRGVRLGVAAEVSPDSCDWLTILKAVITYPSCKTASHTAEQLLILCRSRTYLSRSEILQRRLAPSVHPNLGTPPTPFPDSLLGAWGVS